MVRERGAKQVSATQGRYPGIEATHGTVVVPQQVTEFPSFFGTECSWPCAQVTVQPADVRTPVRRDGASEVAVYRNLPCTERRACALSVAPESSIVYFHTRSGRAMCQSMLHFHAVLVSTAKPTALLV